MATTYTRRNVEDTLRAAGVYEPDGAWGGPPLPEHDPYARGFAVLNDAGLWPHESVVALLPPDGDLGWKPCWELVGTPDAPDPRETPGLPFPFTARELAAWMLHGLGWFVREAMGEWASGPDRGRLSFPEFSKAREALEAAYLAYQDAESSVGRFDPGGALKEALHQAHAACDRAEGTAEQEHDWRVRDAPEHEREARRLKYLAAVRPFREASEDASRAFWEAHATWRRAMVRQLLRVDLANKSGASMKSRRKLSPAQDMEIADKHDGGRGKTKQALSDEYGVSRRLIDAALVRTGSAVKPVKKAAVANATLVRPLDPRRTHIVRKPA